MLYGNSSFQDLQQIAKLNRRSRQFLLDDGANCLPQAFIRGWLAIISIDRQERSARCRTSRALREADAAAQRPVRLRACPDQAGGWCGTSGSSGKTLAPETPLRKIFIALGIGVDVVDNGHAVAVILAEVAQQASAAAHDPQAHGLRIVFVLAQPAHDLRRITGCDLADGVHIVAPDVRVAVSEHLVNDSIRHGASEALRQSFACPEHTLIGAVLLREALIHDGSSVLNGHNVHGAVADVAEHVHALELPEHGHDGGESLRIHIRADDIDVVFDAAPGEIHMIVLEQIGAEALTLGLHPGQGQTGGDVHAGFGHPVLPQLLSDAGECQDVVIRVADLVQGELSVPAADDVVFAVINEQILRVDRLVVEGQHAGGEDAAGGFQVSIAIVNSDDLHVLKLFHNVPLFRLFGENRKDRL